jgi:hypothetical protein
MNAELLSYLLKAKFLEGYRTYLAAAGLLGLALYLLTQGSYEAAAQNFFTALVALGLRDKAGQPLLWQAPGEPLTVDDAPPSTPTLRQD